MPGRKARAYCCACPYQVRQAPPTALAACKKRVGAPAGVGDNNGGGRGAGGHHAQVVGHQREALPGCHKSWGSKQAFDLLGHALNHRGLDESVTVSCKNVLPDKQRAGELAFAETCCEDMQLSARPEERRAIERGPVGGRAWRTTKVVPKRLAGGMSSFRRASISSFSTGLSTTHTRPPSLRYARHTCQPRSA